MENDHIDDFASFDSFEEREEFDTSLAEGKDAPGPMSWRRALIEKAVTNVKQAMEKKIDIEAGYAAGELVFDDETNRFARVLEARPGYLKLSRISGGESVLKSTDNLEYVRKNRKHLTLPQMAQNLFITEIEIIALLNQIDMVPSSAEAAVTKTSQRKNVKAKVKKAQKPEIKVVLSKSALVKPTIKIAAKSKKATVKKNKHAKAPSLTAFSSLIPKGATTDPVADPNGYIQQHFLLLSNRELSIATGLSEHTVRRKLGEWGLRRRDFTNKAKN